MKPNKLTLIFFLACSMWLGACSLLLAADLVVETDDAGNQGKLKTDTFTFSPESQPASVGPEGQAVYFADQLRVSDGASWQAIDDAKTVATRIVGVDRGRDGVAQAGDSNLVGKTADYICDGTADQEEIQDAIDKLASNGGVVYLLEGTYNISSLIVFDNTAPNDSGKALIGTGAGTVLQTEDNPVITASNVNGILISQLRINGPALGPGIGISFSGVTESKIDNVWIENMGGSAIAFSASSNNNTISGNNCQGNGENGIYLDSSSNNTISGNNVQNNDDGGIGLAAPANPSNNNIISGNNISNNTFGAGISIQGCFNNTISGNNIQLNGWQGILLAGSDYNTVSSNNIQSNGYQGISLYYGGDPFLVYSDNNIISGNNIQSNDTSGISNFGSSNIIVGNIIYDNGGSSAQGGIFLSATNDGDNGDNNLVSFNYISDTEGPSTGNPAYMINVDGGLSKDNYIFSNQLIIPTDAIGNLATISDSGTNTKYTGKDKITLEPVTYTPAPNGTIDLTSTGTGPTSYVQLNPAGNISLGSPAIDDGKASGDVLILENISVNQVTINDNANVQLYNDASHTLGTNDTLKLIWNGRDWLEVSFSNN